jgi:hypothetical protein
MLATSKQTLAAILNLSATMALFAANVAPATACHTSAKSKIFHRPNCTHAKKYRRCQFDHGSVNGGRCEEGLSSVRNMQAVTAAMKGPRP